MSSTKPPTSGGNSKNNSNHNSNANGQKPHAASVSNLLAATAAL
jgi:hypothetical protein